MVRFLVSGYDEYGYPTTNWYISVEWIENTVSQCESEPYYYENGTSTIVLPILNVLSCMCFEEMGEVRTFSLGGISMSSAITLNDGSKMPLPHVCADITIGPPSLVPSVEAALEKAGMSRRLIEMGGNTFYSENNDGFTYEGLNLLKYFEELLEEGYKSHTEEQLMAYHKVLFTKHVEVPGSLVYPNYLLDKKLKNVTVLATSGDAGREGERERGEGDEGDEGTRRPIREESRFRKRLKMTM